MNPNRKVRNFHITYNGHYMLDIPFKCDWLGYCYEKEAVEHTHLVLRVIEPISKVNIIRELKLHLEIPCELDVEVHYNIETALGYHIGMGNKPRCTLHGGITMIFPEMLDIDDYIKKKVMHKPTGINQHRERNQILLSTPTNILVDTGMIPLEKIIAIDNAKAAYEWNQPDERAELPDPIPNPWGLYLSNDRDNKQCHYWIWSRESNRGKSTVARQLVREYRGILKAGKYNWWAIRKDCDFVVLDEYKEDPKRPNNILSDTDLNALCDGSYEFDFKNKMIYKLSNQPLVIVLSNKPIHEVYPGNINVVARFNEYELV